MVGKMLASTKIILTASKLLAHKMVGIIVLLLVGIAYAQQLTTGMPAPQLFGTGAPTTSCASDVSYQGLTYIQTDATNGRLWICDQSSGSWGWDHLLSPILGVATTSTFASQSYLLSGCTAIQTVTITGAVVGVNSAAAYPVYASAPSGSPGLLNIAAWVSAANTISVQACAFGIIGSVPAFTAKVEMR